MYNSRALRDWPYSVLVCDGYVALVRMELDDRGDSLVFVDKHLHIQPVKAWNIQMNIQGTGYPLKQYYKLQRYYQIPVFENLLVS